MCKLNTFPTNGFQWFQSFWVNEQKNMLAYILLNFGTIFYTVFLQSLFYLDMILRYVWVTCQQLAQ